MKKKLNEAGIVNELSGRSVFFSDPTPPRAQSHSPAFQQHDEEQQTERKTVRKSERTENRSEYRSEKRTPSSLPIKRSTKRYSFEFFADQIVTLKQLKRQAEDRGESLTLSDIVRQALDEYLKDKK